MAYDDMIPRMTAAETAARVDDTRDMLLDLCGRGVAAFVPSVPTLQRNGYVPTGQGAAVVALLEALTMALVRGQRGNAEAYAVLIARGFPDVMDSLEAEVPLLAYVIALPDHDFVSNA